MSLVVLSSVILALTAQPPIAAAPQQLAQADVAPASVATTAASAGKTPTEAALCENIRLWHRDIVFQMALTLAVGLPAADQPRQTAAQALSQAQEALLDRVQDVYDSACRSGSAEP